MRTQLFLSATGAVHHLVEYGYRQDETGEWYRRDQGLYETHAKIERRGPKKDRIAIVFSEPVEM